MSFGLVLIAFVLLYATQLSSSLAATTRKKVLILHEAHEGSHATCEALGHLCVHTDCREVHDALYHDKRIDFEAINNSSAQVFLTRFFPRDQPLDEWQNYRVLMLVRQDLFAWSMGMYHFVNPREELGKAGQNVTFKASLLDKDVKKRVRASALVVRLCARVCFCGCMERMTWNGACVLSALSDPSTETAPTASNNHHVCQLSWYVVVAIASLHAACRSTAGSPKCLR